MTYSQSGVARPSAWYRGVRAVIRLLFFLLADYKVSGREHIPDAGPMIIAINHMSAVDLPAVMLAIPHQATAFAASKHQGGLRGLILRSVHVIFVRRGTPDRKALRQALEVLQSGGVLGLAPEGTRSPTKTLLRAKPGAAFLAVRSSATVLPIGLMGTETVLRSWRHLHRPKIRVVIGEPYKLEASRNGRPDFQALSDEIMLSIAGLLPEEYRGEYADRDRGNLITDREKLND